MTGNTGLSTKDRVFQADTDLEVWLTLPIAGHLFWRFWLIPFMGKYPSSACREIIMNPGDQVEEDTAWLQARLTRMPDHVRPYRHSRGPVGPGGEGAEANGPARQPAGAGPMEPPTQGAEAAGPTGQPTDAAPEGPTAIVSASGGGAGGDATVAVDTFKVLFQKDPRQISYRLTIIETLAVPSNTGVRSTRAGCKSKNAMFDDSIAAAPHLWKKLPANRNYRGKDRVPCAVTVYRLGCVGGRMCPSSVDGLTVDRVVTRDAIADCLRGALLNV